MSTRGDIEGGRLVYTCNCGWIDLGHLRSSSSANSSHASAQYLWQDVLNERGLTIGNRSDRHVIGYTQRMRALGVTAENFQCFWVKRGLSLPEKRAVTLSIFMEVSYGFESLQQSYSLFTNSGFSEEDLVSNLIGLYVQIFGMDWKPLCQPVSKDASRAVWDANGPVGSHKNKTFKPNLYPCKECKETHKILAPAFPPIFNTIQPAKK